MSKFTTEVRYICEHYAGLEESVGYDGVQKVCEKAAPSIFEMYPIFDEAYRQALNVKILRHFYTREIGAETVGLWKLWLNNKMNEIMPYYNQLYKSQLIEFNPLYNVDITTHKEGTADEDSSRGQSRINSRSSKGEVDSTAKNDTNSVTGTTINQDRTRHDEDKYSETPQGSLEGVLSGDYLTNARVLDGNDTNKENNTTIGNANGESAYTENNSRSENETEMLDGTSKIKNTEDYTETVLGKQGDASYSKLLAEFRATMLNIDMQIINELNPLFMGLWE